MKHTYELRKFNDDESLTTVLRITDEPKYVKQRAKEYANRNPGLYTLCKIEETALYFTENKKNK
jgi:hypothetical protein